MLTNKLWINEKNYLKILPTPKTFVRWTKLQPARPNDTVSCLFHV